MNHIERECRVFTEHLIGQAPDPYILRKYGEAHTSESVYTGGSRFDAFLVNVASTHRMLAKLADSYARIFFPTALLRKKLILLLAILETSASSFRAMEAVDGGSNAALVARLCGRLFLFVLGLVFGVLLFAPVQIVFRVLQGMGGSRNHSVAARPEFSQLTPTSARERRDS
jgi:hypothetical protein